MTNSGTLCKVCLVTPVRDLQPTLWRTCRVLANRTRLQMFHLLSRRSSQTVSAVAERMKLALPVASQYLRALEARGLLVTRRVGRRVEYRPSTASAGTTVPTLVAALKSTFEREPEPVETLFKLASAFTHPRRIEVFRVLKVEARTLEEIRNATGISTRALRRHLGKLEARGFVVCWSDTYAMANRADPFGRELARLAPG